MSKVNKQGCEMKIIDYINATNITIQFQDEFHFITEQRTWQEFQKGSIINPYYKSVYGIGYLGNKYPSRINGKHTLEYIIWHSMFVRCYSNTSINIRPTYNEAFIDKMWYNFENFYEWIHTQKNFESFTIDDKCQLDKDILFKHNKKYSADRCLLVPQSINKLFTKREARRGEYPIGVHKAGNKFIAQCQNVEYGRQVYLGSYNNPQQAFLAYKKYKEQLIKDTARMEYFNNRITKQCYEAMNNYIVEITD